MTVEARTVNSAFLLLILLGSVAAQTKSALHLSDYVGTYADAPGHSLEMVDGDGLFAVLDEAQYPLRPSGPDRFTTITGQTVPFIPDANGKVTGYEQDGKFHAQCVPCSNARVRCTGPSAYRWAGITCGLSLPSARRPA